MTYFLIIISAIFVNNIVLAQFLGICPFLGVSNKLSTATGMSMAVCFVITLATLVTWLINRYLLVPFGLTFLQTIAFILVIASLVQMVEIVLKKLFSASPSTWLPSSSPSAGRPISSASASPSSMPSRPRSATASRWSSSPASVSSSH